MSTIEDWSKSPAGRALSSGLVTRPKLGLADMVLLLWRAVWLMLAVFLPIFLIGLFVAMQMPKTYTATSRLLVSLGDEYVYRPSIGPDSASVAPGTESLIQSEIELLRSPVVAEDAVSHFPMGRIFPEIANACSEKLAISVGDSSSKVEYACKQMAVRAFRESFKVSAAPDIPVLTTEFRHKDPDLAAEVLNAAVGSYLKYRSDVFSKSNTGALTEQRKRFQADLKEADEALRQFLADNRFGNFEAEGETIRNLYQSASSDLLATQSRLRQAEGQLAVQRTQIKGIPAQQDMYVDDSSQQALTDLKMEREEKLTRYNPDSKVIQEIDRRIAQVEEYLASKENAEGVVRRGPNPLYQSVLASIQTLEAEVASLRSQESELQRQIADFERRQQTLTELQPEYQSLVRQRDILAQNVRSFSEREIEARSRSELAQQSADNIRVLEAATPPVKGKSLRLPVAVLSLLFAGFTALLLGLVKVFTVNGFVTGRSLERTLGIPVIASVRRF